MVFCEIQQRTATSSISNNKNVYIRRKFATIDKKENSMSLE
jgi:hypothetical protein